MKKNYSDDIITFDIETSQIQIEENSYSFPYTFQICENGNVFIFRSWNEILEYFDKFQKSDKTTIIWVHNLSYEFSFLSGYLHFDDVFARVSHKPIYATCGKIEFRCTYFLSMNKLETLAKNENLGIEKKVGDLDYVKIRHSTTPLTSDEIGYCENDVLIIYKYILKLKNIYGSISEIPLTSTGRVRKSCIEILGKNLSAIHQKAAQYSAKNEKMQRKFLSAFSGAFTHANYKYVGKILEDVHSWDINSSYPTRIVSEKFPTEWIERKIDEKNVYDIVNDIILSSENTATILTITFHNLKATTTHSILSLHKCDVNGRKTIDNGRIRRAEFLTTTITELDLINISKFYSYEIVEISYMIQSEKKYLPRPFFEMVGKFYSEKTLLKGVVGQEENYMRSKFNLNGIYGMFCLDLLSDDTKYNQEENKWYYSEKPYSDFEKSLKNKKMFYWYTIGVYIMAYSRHELLKTVYDLQDDIIYNDTDSNKHHNKHDEYYQKYNEYIIEKIKTACENVYYDYEKFIYYLDNDEIDYKKTIGCFDYEGKYDKFKTLGAKRYITKHDDKIETTVAGAPKSLSEYLTNQNKDVFESFCDGLVYPHCKKTHKTFTENFSVNVVDYLGNEQIVEIRNGITLHDTDFTMSLSSDFLQFLKNPENNKYIKQSIKK